MRRAPRNAHSYLAGILRMPFAAAAKRRCRSRAAVKARGACLLHGFTLVELLVVIAIIGVLIALLLPAVQAAREAARRTSCSNHLKQIGLAVTSFESTHRYLPAGADWEPEKIARGSVLIFLLPYLELSNIYDAYDFKQANIDDAVFSGTSERIGSTPIETYVCPSDSHDEVPWPLHNYSASRGPTGLANNPACPCDFSWQDFALAPDGDRYNFAGPFSRLGSECEVRQITDGMSHTIFFGETLPACSSHGLNGWAKTNNGNGYCSTLIPINYDTCNANDVDPCHRPCNWNTEVGFRSSHSGGAFFLMGDGAVRFLQDNIDFQTYQYLGAKSDGHSTDDSS